MAVHHHAVLGRADHTHAAAPRPKLGPLARGVGHRLAWAGGLSALLWLAVYWALS
jgi:hypothetical protein